MDDYPLNKRFLVKVTTNGNSLVASIPEEFLKHLDVQRGDMLYWIAGPNGTAKLVKFRMALPQEIIEA